MKKQVNVELPKNCVEKLVAAAAERGEELSTLVEQVLIKRLPKVAAENGEDLSSIIDRVLEQD